MNGRWIAVPAGVLLAGIALTACGDVTGSCSPASAGDGGGVTLELKNVAGVGDATVKTVDLALHFRNLKIKDVTVKLHPAAKIKAGKSWVSTEEVHGGTVNLQTCSVTGSG